MAISQMSKKGLRERSNDNRRLLEDYLISAISDGSFTTGKFPPERELSSRFGIPRYTVRKTIAGLSERFPVMRNAGRGTYLAVPSQAPEAVHSNYSPAEIIQARLAVEPGFVEFIVMNATRRDFEEMENCLAAAAKVKDGRDFKRWIYRLHIAIAAATHNKLLSHIFQMIAAAREAEGWQLLHDSLCATAEGRSKYLAENRKIVDALRKREASRARQLLNDHLVGVYTALVARPNNGAL